MDTDEEAIDIEAPSDQSSSSFEEKYLKYKRAYLREKEVCELLNTLSILSSKVLDFISIF